MDIDVLDRLVRNEAIGRLARSGVHQDTIRLNPGLIAEIMPQVVQDRLDWETPLALCRHSKRRLQALRAVGLRYSLAGL